MFCYYAILMSPILNNAIFSRSKTRTTFLILKSLKFAPLALFCGFSLIRFYLFRIISSHIWRFTGFFFYSDFHAFSSIIMVYPISCIGFYLKLAILNNIYSLPCIIFPDSWCLSCLKLNSV